MSEKKERQPRSKERGPGKAGTHRVTFNVSCQPHELEQIKQLAITKGQTVSKMILEAVLK